MISKHHSWAVISLTWSVSLESMDSEQKRKPFISNVKHVVLKMGTKVLLSHFIEHPDRIRQLISDIAAFREVGYQFSIVSSGAVGFGMKEMGIEVRPTDLKKIQALASVGQSLLMQKWNGFFAEQGIQTGQILLTYDVIENRKRYLHASDCLRAVLDYGAVPIINENDSVAVDELKFGDNDTLSALTAILMDAELLIIFSDIDGLFTKNPHKHEDAERIDFIDQIDENILNLIDDRQNDLSMGGMRSKLTAARRSAQMGTGVVICDGYRPNLPAILNGEDVGTFIRPEKKYEKKRKRWIFFNHKVKGRIIIDAGAVNALVNHSKSLLPGGVIGTEGCFEKGHIVGIYNEEEELIGKGITSYGNVEIEQIKGQHTNHIKTELGGNSRGSEIVHRDNMIVL
jgi:glutamate 5-kinase